VVVSNALGSATNTGSALAVIPDSSTAAGVTLSNVYVFTGDGDGSGVLGLTLDPNGALYGTSEYGGTNNSGNVFVFTTQGGFSSLYSFSGDNDGANPYAKLTRGRDGKYYGTTLAGGEFGSGTVFSIAPDGTFTNLYSFDGGDNGGDLYSDLALGSNGVFYGTTYSGGVNGYGTVFSITGNGNFTNLYSFDFYHGASPYGGLVPASDGYLYGTTDFGGNSNLGTVFRISQSGNFHYLFSFSGTNGSEPSTDLAQGRDGNLYGRTCYGGDYDLGTIYRIGTNGIFEHLFSFSGADGATPYGSLLSAADGWLYGAAQSGGTNGQDGVVYRVNTNGTVETLVWFDGSNGRVPFAGLAQAGDDSFYGTTFNGVYGYGSIFQMAVAPPSAPIRLNTMVLAGTLSFTWSAGAGQLYQVQYRTNLNQAGWSNLGNPVAGANGTASFSETIGSNSEKFYRVEAVP
jgi:uncharacterized repeat protein (TIGR03803 family)